jgi:hypothetical protein
MINISVGPSDVDFPSMTRAQQEGRNGTYANAMAGYLKWLAPRYEAIKNRLPEMIEKYREAASEATRHKHTPENIANLAVGMHYFLEFAAEVGAITTAEREAWWKQSWTALCQVGRAQAVYQEVNDPSDQFISYLGSAITSGYAFVALKNGEPPPMATNWGWRKEPPYQEARGELVGWIDGVDLYLEPTSAYRIVQRMARDANGSLALGAHGARQAF